MPNAVGNLSDNLMTEQVIDLVFKHRTVKHGLTEFDDLGKKPHEVLKTYPVEVASGKAQGERRYYLKCFKRQQDIQVYSEKKTNGQYASRTVSRESGEVTDTHPLSEGTAGDRGQGAAELRRPETVQNAPRTGQAPSRRVD